jgi:hypothetical protein
MDEPTPLFHGSWVQPALSEALLIVFFTVNKAEAAPFI